ncbi:hypothetical protein MATR_30520 [Marivirga tractuosa]|uniref:Beta-Ig-H3/fasciclin n=1 Tax=Marivirga tractuosa (strain ATCC 23168 / DSM 4126 / NBRC 15989 / NCIMB 1408 / VKM B-1430 / H-43) TaxID=643867 RepID=E4TUK6_MARTH|nr:fasciclin domain-containing protein [Marivirga tractuosa]ADR23099.1 beta-Ig-H3/fasciclin [Marivirga tractuosa DSM 4126]BDD16227.1 hypothetical protein MATR_30520 [Marivirga tractuosa]
MKKKNLFLKSTSSLLAMLFVVMSAFMFTACDPEEEEDPEPEPESSILEIVAESDSHTQLEAFVNADTDLAATLGGDDLTLFAPNDAAFDKLKIALGVESLEQIRPDVIAAVLRFHAVNSVERRESFSEETELTTVQSENITFNAEGNIFTGCSDTDVQFVGEEILATNGVVHVVETILVPTSICNTIGANLNKVSQTILLSANFSVLADAIAKADTYAAETEGVTPLTQILTGSVEGLSQITVLAPPNQVFEMGKITIDSFEPQQWYGIIANHVIGSKELREEFTYIDADNIVTFRTLAQGTITVVPSGGLDSNGQSGAEATFAVDPDTGEEIVNIESENGVVHAIAGILLPASSGRYAVDAKYGLNK